MTTNQAHATPADPATAKTEPRYPNAPDYVNQPGFPEPDEANGPEHDTNLQCTNTQTHEPHKWNGADVRLYWCQGISDPFALLPDVD